jgi:uncharacterized protein GlcG (DUF336 family)
MLEKAKRAIEAAEGKAREIGVPMVIAVVDQGGNLVAQHRMDGALLASIAISRDKAYSAVALKMSTEQAGTLAQPGQMLYGLNTTDGCRMVVFGGGCPSPRAGRDRRPGRERRVGGGRYPRGERRMAAWR